MTLRKNGRVRKTGGKKTTLADSVKGTFAKVFGGLKNMEKGKRTRLIVLVSLILTVIIVVSIILNQKTYTVLYSGMESADTAQVLSMLSEMGVEAKADGEDTVLVAGTEVDTVRLKLAAEGYPSSGLNYDIYNSASGLGVTDSQRNVYYQYQTQENLRKTIEQMEKVEKAVVNIDLGDDSSYVLSDKNDAATASILLTLKDGQKLGKSEVKAIGELVSKSISGLELENVRIVDTQMTLYSLAEDSEAESADTQLALQNNVKQQLQQQIISLLSPVFGDQNVLAEVNVKLDFDKTVSESVEYKAPEGRTEGLVVSMKELVEAITNDTQGGIPGIDANGNASQYLGTIAGNGDAVYYNLSREVNYEINETKTQIEKAQGQIESLSVSVILNSTNTRNYSDEVKKLVSTAIGANADNINVEMLPFAETDPSVAEEAAQSLNIQHQIMTSVQGEQTMRMVILVIGGLIVLIFIFAIIKTLRPGREVYASEPEGFELIADEEIIPEPGGEDVDLKNVDLDFEAKDDNLSVLKEYVNKNPESVANLLRNWLNED